MARYIDADVLKEQMEFVCMGIMAGTDPYNAPLNTIDDAPTADVVKVVRCKDCKHHGDDHFCCYPWCTTPEEFCSRGERKDSSKVS